MCKIRVPFQDVHTWWQTCIKRKLSRNDNWLIVFVCAVYWSLIDRCTIQLLNAAFFVTIPKPRATTRAITPLHHLCDVPCHHLSILTACQPHRDNLHQRPDPTPICESPQVSESQPQLTPLRTRRQTVVLCLDCSTEMLQESTVCLRIIRFTITNHSDWWHTDEFDDCWVNKEKQNKLHLSITLHYSVDLSALKYIVLWLIEQYTFSYKYKSVL